MSSGMLIRILNKKENSRYSSAVVCVSTNGMEDMTTFYLPP